MGSVRSESEGVGSVRSESEAVGSVRSEKDGVHWCPVNYEVIRMRLEKRELTQICMMTSI